MADSARSAGRSPFGRKNKLEIGFCVGIAEEGQRHKGTEAQRRERKFKLKRIERVIDKEPLLDVQLMELARWISSYYVCPLGQVLAAMVPAAVKKGAGLRTQTCIYLAAADDRIIEQLKGKKQKQVVAFLKERKAYSSGSALDLQEVLDAADCGRDCIKKLAEKQIIKIHQKTIFDSFACNSQRGCS